MDLWRVVLRNVALSVFFRLSGAFFRIPMSYLSLSTNCLIFGVVNPEFALNRPSGLLFCFKDNQEPFMRFFCHSQNQAVKPQCGSALLFTMILGKHRLFASGKKSTPKTKATPAPKSTDPKCSSSATASLSGVEVSINI